MNKVFIISGIDTGCGKTFITGHLGKNLQVKGYHVVTHKMVQTGCTGISPDIIEHRKIMNINLLDEDREGLTCPYVFPFPASPHLSSKLENKIIDTNNIISSIQQLEKRYDIVLSEGAGGLMVPLTNEVKIFDLVHQHNFPLILVSSSKLGSINHTLLSIEICARYNIDLRLVVYNIFPEDDPVITASSRKTIAREFHKKFPGSILIDSNELIHQKTDLTGIL